MEYKELEESAARLISHFFQSPHWVKYPYHNLKHTTLVVQHATDIARFYALDDRETCIVTVAAWFHDAGQLAGEAEGHEERSIVLMENFFSSSVDNDELMPAVKACILATKAGAVPVTLNEKIICDADTWHFGTPYFRETEFLVKQEMELRTGKQLPNWHQGSLQLLENHVYFTEYAQLLLTEGKKANMAWLQSLLAHGDA